MLFHQGILLFLLLDFTKSIPYHQRATSLSSSSKSIQNIIDEEQTIRIKSANSVSHIIARSYNNFKEVVDNSISFQAWRSDSSVTVGPSVSATSKQKRDTRTEASSDVANLAHLKLKPSQHKSFSFNGSSSATGEAVDEKLSNSRVVKRQDISTKSIKGPNAIVAIITKRSINFKLPKWNFSSWRGWGGQMGKTGGTGSVARSLQRTKSLKPAPNVQNAQSTQNGQGSLSFLLGIRNRLGWSSHTAEPKQAGKANARVRGDIGVGRGRHLNRNGPPASRKGSPASRNGSPASRKGSPVGRKGSPVGRKGSPVGRKGSPVGRKNKALKLKGKLPIALPVMSKDASKTQSKQSPAVRTKKKHDRTSSFSDDSQTEAHQRPSRARAKQKSNHSSGSSDSQSEETPRARKSSKIRKPAISSFKVEDYYKSDRQRNHGSSSSGSDSEMKKSLKARPRKKLKSPPFIPATDPQSSNTTPKTPENKIPSQVDNSPSSSNKESEKPESNTNNNPTPANNPIDDKVQNPENIPQYQELQLMGQKPSSPDKGSMMYDSDADIPGQQLGFNRPSNPHRFGRLQMDDMDAFHRGGSRDNGESTVKKIGKTVGELLPIAQTIGNIVTGQGNMGYGMGSGYGGHDDMDAFNGGFSGGHSGHSGGYGRTSFGGGGFGRSSFGGSGFGGGGFGGGGFGGGSFGAGGYDSGGNGGGDSVGLGGTDSGGSGGGDSVGLGGTDSGGLGGGLGGDGDLGHDGLSGGNKLGGIHGHPDGKELLDENKNKGGEKNSQKSARKSTSKKNNAKKAHEVVAEGRGNDEDKKDNPESTEKASEKLAQNSNTTPKPDTHEKLAQNSKHTPKPDINDKGTDHSTRPKRIDDNKKDNKTHENKFGSNDDTDILDTSDSSNMDASHRTKHSKGTLR